MTGVSEPLPSPEPRPDSGQPRPRRRSDTSLEELLAQVRRLRVRLPGSRLLVEHEIEVLQRLGRLEEAAALAQKLREAKP